jgi:hypothetical protein
VNFFPTEYTITQFIHLWFHLHISITALVVKVVDKLDQKTEHCRNLGVGLADMNIEWGYLDSTQFGLEILEGLDLAWEGDSMELDSSGTSMKVAVQGQSWKR